MRHRILLQTNPPFLKTGLAENGRALAKYLYGRGYDIAYYCTQTSEMDPQLNLTPWKSYGALPSDPRIIQELNQDPGRARNAAYGAYNIDKVIADYKPTIWWGSDDAWSFSHGDYMDKPWWKKINSILHITVDSLPVIDQALKQAKDTKHFFTWAKFAQREMHRLGFPHVGQIYGAGELSHFSPITEQERFDLRKRFGISPDTVIFNYVFRNQLRKRVLLLLRAFAEFKRENPSADVKLHLHTSVAEKIMGWDIPKMMDYYGVKKEDVLFTYVCKQCGNWFVAPYQGEDINCPYCRAEKSVVTPTIQYGVPNEEMKYLYGISDACFSVANSGGQEYCASQALLTGKPLACVNYSYGVDYCEQDFVYPLGFYEDNEPGTNFIKAVARISDIKKFMNKVWKMPRKEVIKWGERGLGWAQNTFSIDTIGKQWTDLFDSMPHPDWSSITLTPEPKNEQFPFPEVDDQDEFITTLYTGILKMDEPPDGAGRANWRTQLGNGMSRRAVYDFFINVARQENAKNNAKPVDFWDQIDKTTGRKRALFIMRRSFGDCLMATQLFESFHQQYPNHDLYVACEGQYRELFAGNPNVFKVLEFQPFMEHEMICIGAGQTESFFDVYFHPAIQAQDKLSYLSSSSIAQQLT